MADSDVVLIQFAKRPIPGLVKTRLIPELGEKEAARVHEVLLMQTLQTLIESDVGMVQLWWDAEWDDREYLNNLSPDQAVETRVQQGTDLGERMHHALDNQLRRYPKVILVGSDCPVLDAGYLAQAAAALDHIDLVIGPSDDGGYVLIGAKRITPGIFDGVDWGTDSVMSSTLNRVHESGLSVVLLPGLWDVDVFGDYGRWRSLLGE